MNTLLLRRFAMMGNIKKDYIQFEDPEVERICIEKFSSDGIGVTYRDAAAVTTLPVAAFRGNTDIVTFDELKYFTRLTTITDGSSSSVLGAFGGCSSLVSIELPEGITTIGNFGFMNCSGLTGRLVIPDLVNKIGVSSFNGCSSLSSVELPERLRLIYSYAFYQCTGIRGDLILPPVTTIGKYAFYHTGFDGKIVVPSSVSTIENGAFGAIANVTDVEFLTTMTITKNMIFIDGNSTSNSYLGNGNGHLIIKGNYQPNGGNTGGPILRFKNVYIHGSLNTGDIAYPASYSGVQSLRVKGDIIHTRTSSTGGGLMKNVGSIFIEGTNVDVRYRLIMSTSTGTRYLHTCKNSVISSTPTTCSSGSFSKIYVGDGSSRSNDEAVLALYLADTNWSAQSAKLATWYDYNGEYKWYYVTDNLTNCTNTNPDEWPHITRGEEYRTTIKANEGYTLQSVQVQMYQCEDNGVTPDTPIDITSQVYDASTGEIYIQEVFGNVIITASAS